MSEAEDYANYCGEGRWDDRPLEDQPDPRDCTHLAALLLDDPVCAVCGTSLWDFGPADAA